MKNAYITSHPKILGGTPVITGTRVPIDVILYRLKEGYTLKEVHNMYRHISVDKLQKAIGELIHKLPAITTHDNTSSSIRSFWMRMCIINSTCLYLTVCLTSNILQKITTE